MTAELSLRSVPGIPRIAPGDDLGAMLCTALRAADVTPRPGDVLVLCSKLLSRAEGRFVDLSTVEASARARKLAAEVGKEPALVELILAESTAVSRSAPGVLIVRHRLGFVSANAAIDASNAMPAHAAPGSGPWVLLMPADPDATARALRQALAHSFGVDTGILISDSHGRPFRRGAIGVAVGASGLSPVLDRRGERDLDGRELEHTESALADQLAAAADLLAGQAGEGRPVTLIRGMPLANSPDNTDDDDGHDHDQGARTICRAPGQDLYA